MAVILPSPTDIIAGVTTQCEVFEKVRELIAFSETLKIGINENDTDIGDIALLLPHTNVVDAIAAINALAHVSATVASPTGTIGVVASGTDSQTFELDVNVPSIISIGSSGTAPPATATLWFQTDTGKGFFWDGATWIAITT